MSETIRVPDIGSGEGEVIELFVKVGDRIEADQSILTLESDKASMEIPAPKAGVVKALKVKLGDRLKEGDELLELESEEGTDSEAPAQAAAEPAAASTGGPTDKAEAPTPPGDDNSSASAEEGESQEIKVPDIGSSGKASVIEISVKAGDTIAAEQPLITLESDKASMEIPSPAAGVVESISVKVGDEVGTGDLILILKGTASSKPAAASAPASQAQGPAKEKLTEQAAEAPAETAGESVEEVRIPDIGSSGSAKVIEVMIKAGDSVEADQSLITLESDKASMEIPAPKAGVVESLSIKVGDDAKTGDLILTLKVQGSTPAKKAESRPQEAVSQQQAVAPNKQGVPEAKAAATPAPAVSGPSKAGTKVHAGPAVRMTAREYGVDLADVPATGPKGRILKEDVQAYVKNMLHKAKQAPAEGASGGAGIPPIPAVDFSKFGEVEEVAMSRLMQIGAANLHRSWLNVPHVTQFESADITELEAFRVSQKAAAEKAGVKLTVLP
ncbi:MAG: E3 binding domain-containing protein, partial [Gammaproteobacteria bacterium]|nr:E3 binding domain-containing protein [Gammaproteobacteria bacterium]